MILQIEPIEATFGAVVSNLHPDSMDDVTWRALYAAWLRYALLVFPGLNLTHDQQMAFAKRFGPLEVDMVGITNMHPDGTLLTEKDDADYLNILRGNYSWHTDSSFRPIHAKGAVYSAEIVPSSGGETGWADMRAAYDALDDVLRTRVEGLTARHSLHRAQLRAGHQLSRDGLDATLKAYYEFEDKAEPVRSLVKVHPETGRKSLLIGRHAYDVSGMSETESEKFLDELHAFACQPPRTYHHDWKPGDAVVWDNRCLLHRVLPWDMIEPRRMWHTRIAGDPTTEAALGECPRIAE